jgi:hypothetical protein
MHGPGISTYFKGLKAFLFALMLMSVIATPTIVLLVFGPFVSTSDVELTLKSTMLGNLGGLNATRLFLPLTQCGASSFNADGTPSTSTRPCSITKTTAQTLFSSLDVSGVVVWIVVMLWLRRMNRLEERDIMRVNVTIANYTVLVKGIPPMTVHNE